MCIDEYKIDSQCNLTDGERVPLPVGDPKTGVFYRAKVRFWPEYKEDAERELCRRMLEALSPLMKEGGEFKVKYNRKHVAVVGVNTQHWMNGEMCIE